MSPWVKREPGFRARNHQEGGGFEDQVVPNTPTERLVLLILIDLQKKQTLLGNTKGEYLGEYESAIINFSLVSLSNQPVVGMVLSFHSGASE